jgi:hypothetical protein
VKLAAQFRSWLAALTLALTIDAVLIVFAVFVHTAGSAFQASPVGATTTRTALRIALTSSALVLLTDLTGGAVLRALAHAVFENARSAATSLMGLAVRIFTALRAVFLEAVLSLFAILVATAVWKLGFLVGAGRQQSAETENEQQSTEAEKLRSPSRS